MTPDAHQPVRSPLIAAPALRSLLEQDAPVVLLDVRWVLGRRDGDQDYARGHLPGAVYVDLDEDLSGPATLADGRHPLPDRARLQQALRAWGVHPDSVVVAYDDRAGLGSSRAWWVLRWAGLADVRILDGGLAAWRRAGGELSTTTPTPAPGSVVVAAGLAAQGRVLDARPADRYAGASNDLDPRPGHLPGAHSLPFTDLLADDGTFAPPAELRDRLRATGVRTDGPVGVYCGSGVSAAVTAAALATIDVESALYPGSWSQWAADPDRPVVLGAAPDDLAGSGR